MMRVVSYGSPFADGYNNIYLGDEIDKCMETNMNESMIRSSCHTTFNY